MQANRTQVKRAMWAVLAFGEDMGVMSGDSGDLGDASTTASSLESFFFNQRNAKKIARRACLNASQ